MMWRYPRSGSQRIRLLWNSDSQLYGVSLGKWWVLLKGPQAVTLFSERNAEIVGRDSIRVYPLVRGWRIVARNTEKHT